MSKDLGMVESEKFEDWSRRLLQECEEVALLSVDEIGEATKSEAEKQLLHFRRQGK